MHFIFSHNEVIIFWIGGARLGGIFWINIFCHFGSNIFYNIYYIYFINFRDFSSNLMKTKIFSIRYFLLLLL